MPGSEPYFLSFNRDQIFIGLIASEGHFRYVTPSKDSEDLSCIVKHLADIEGHCDEAVSHSLSPMGVDASGKFGELRDKVKGLRKRIQEDNVSATEGIAEIRSMRGFFESFNPDYDISKCTTCGTLEEAVLIKETLLKLKGNPEEGIFKEKDLNYPQPPIHSVNPKMGTRNEVLGIYGSELIAKAAEKGFVELDRSVGKLGAPLHERPSVWLNMGLGIGIPLITLWRNVGAPWDLPLIAGGGHLFSKVVDYLQEALMPAVAVTATRVVYRPDGVKVAEVARVRMPNQRVHTTPPIIQARYASVGPSYSVKAYTGF